MRMPAAPLPARRATVRVERFDQNSREEKAQAHGNFQLFRDYPTITPQPLRRVRPGYCLLTIRGRFWSFITPARDSSKHTHEKRGTRLARGRPEAEGQRDVRLARYCIERRAHDRVAALLPPHRALVAGIRMIDRISGIKYIGPSILESSRSSHILWPILTPSPSHNPR